jgi:hypothetical protein
VMKLLFSTAAVHPRDRLAYWREEATKAFVRHEFSTKRGRNFSRQGAVFAEEFRTAKTINMQLYQ